MSVATPVSSPSEPAPLMVLQLKDNLTISGYSFGAPTSASGELVFQTGMVGYPESITDPSYEGQILVITYPIVGNYGVPDTEAMDELLKDVPKYFESHRIHVAGLVVANYTEEYSHYLAKSSLGDWLKKENIPAICGVDTRHLTKHLRNKGSTLGRLCLQSDLNAIYSSLTGDFFVDWESKFNIPEWVDPNLKNLVAKVSIKEPKLYKPDPQVAIKKANGETVRVLAIDVGMKFNQIRCFVNRGVELKIVPWNYDFLQEKYDGLFISNGPGDPSVLSEVVAKLRVALKEAKTPIFGICLGHQLIARASGASTLKLKFGNRGHNIPATSTISGRCYITSQNHGYAVDTNTLQNNWKELFVNANDGSNEGIYHTDLPFFSVQFHPESTPGPKDTEFLFDTFIDTILKFDATKKLAPVHFPGGTLAENRAAHPQVKVKKVLILGSGGLSIGQAGEFDYSGSQAIKALKEEGIYTILINPNIATIQTSKGLADKVYFLPVNAEFVRKVIKEEKPDGIYVTFGGQTALSVGIELKDEFESLGVKVLGTPVDTVITTEDRELFASAMEEINEKCAKSHATSNIEESIIAARDIGFPVIVRAAFALGGLGSGFADNEEQLVDLCNKAFATSPQVLIERSMKGWKEIEYEVVRDAFDNCITVCNMENFDPLGIHTGDSIVVAPSQTLSDDDYNMLRTTAINVIRHLGVVGECNIQYALNPFSKEYCIIEVNARLSRSSALASKATGYPLAYTAAKLGLNIPLNEITNEVTKSTCSCFEPSLDYIVTKIPRWDLKKFTRVSTTLSSSMKSVGEVMAIGRSFEECIQKAIRESDYQNLGFNPIDGALMSIDNELQTPSDQRLFAIANALSEGYTVDKIWELTKIDKWFLNKLARLIDIGREVSKYGQDNKRDQFPVDLLRKVKQLGFDDRQVAKFLNSNESAVRNIRKEHGIFPSIKQIDTVAAEFPSHTNYLYLTYNADSHDVSFEDENAGSIIVLGSGVYRIGSSVEFDYCSVTTVRTLRKEGFKTIIVNYNPETVSTDFDESDSLFFENINNETVLDIYDLTNSGGVVVSMGGQTSNNIALNLYRQNVKILGTSPEMIDGAENRYKFSRMLDSIGVYQPAWKELTSINEAQEFANRVSYPVLVRPSYVLSGAAMNVCYSDHELKKYLNEAVAVSRDYPVVITKFIQDAKEIEMDAVSRDGKLVMHVVSEHVENAGVHSGDATLVVPPQDLSKHTVSKIVYATAKIAEALNITGPLNIQFIAKDEDIKVIECNVRASRSFPFVSKIVGTDLIDLATKAIAGVPFKAYPNKKLPEQYVGIKVPQFSFARLLGADPVLGVEMASTGEVAAIGKDKYDAYLKAYMASGLTIPKKNILLSIGSYREKQELLPAIKKLIKLGYNLYGTSGTFNFYQEHGVAIQFLEVLDDNVESEHSLNHYLAQNLIDLYINIPSNNKVRRPATYVSKGYVSRRMAIDYAVPLVTNNKVAKLLINAIARKPADIPVGDVDTLRSFPEQAANDNDDYSSPLSAITSPAYRKFSFNRTKPTDDAFEQSFERLEQAIDDSDLVSQPLPKEIKITGPLEQYIRSNNPFLRRSVTSVKQFSRSDLHILFTIAAEMRLAVQRQGVLDLLKGRVLTTMFYEPSTRTSTSFNAAMQRLGGRVVEVKADTSSVKKGETLKDTIMTLAAYSDAIVLRHPETSSITTAAKVSPIPVINAGNGSYEHPTQAFLDLFTIREELGTVNGITVTFVGDLKYGRTVHSLVTLLKHYHVKINLVSPDELQLPEEIRSSMISSNQLGTESEQLTKDIIAETDVLYVTRVQQERFSTVEEYERLKDSFIIDNKVLSHAKQHMCVLHPLPRVNEIKEEVDFDHRAAYFRQMRYGLFVRMALLALVVGVDFW